MQENILTLLELNTRIKNVINDTLKTSVWVKAEIADIRENFNGHCYLELVEKNEQGESITAKSRATIWAFTYRMLKPYFETTTGKPLEAGMKILINASVDFHELYGLSLNIKDIDPSYTVGDMELQRQKVIKRLRDEGVIDMNKQLPFPLVPQRLAVISSATAAGYEDFINQIENNGNGYKFYYRLFDAVMQGQNTEESIINALDRINSHCDNFDVVVIIRGGGARSDLSSFDSYWLSFNVAQFPLPVLTGIGHERDNCVLDIVANQRLKTPTAVAEFLIGKMNEFELYLDDALGFLANTVQDEIEKNTVLLKNLPLRLGSIVSGAVAKQNLIISSLDKNIETNAIRKINSLNNILSSKYQLLHSRSKLKLYDNRNSLDSIFKLLKTTASGLNNKQMSKIALLENSVNLVNPVNVLKRGYTVTLSGNKVVKSSSNLSKGDILTNRFHDGDVQSTVN